MTRALVILALASLAACDDGGGVQPVAETSRSVTDAAEAPDAGRPFLPGDCTYVLGRYECADLGSR